MLNINTWDNLQNHHFTLIKDSFPLWAHNFFCIQGNNENWMITLFWYWTSPLYFLKKNRWDKTKEIYIESGWKVVKSLELHEPIPWFWYTKLRTNRFYIVHYIWHHHAYQIDGQVYSIMSLFYKQQLAEKNLN